SRPSVAALSAIGRGRASVQGVEERSVDPSHLSPARNPNRSPYFHCVSGLLSAGHAETAAEDAGAGIDGEGRARKPRNDADDRCRAAHDGRSGGCLVPLYGAREGSAAPPSTVEAPTSRPAPTENHCPEQLRRRVSAHSLWFRPLAVVAADVTLRRAVALDLTLLFLDAAVLRFRDFTMEGVDIFRLRRFAAPDLTLARSKAPQIAGRALQWAALPRPAHDDTNAYYAAEVQSVLRPE